MAAGNLGLPGISLQWEGPVDPLPVRWERKEGEEGGREIMKKKRNGKELKKKKTKLGSLSSISVARNRAGRIELDFGRQVLCAPAALARFTGSKRPAEARVILRRGG